MRISNSCLRGQSSFRTRVNIKIINRSIHKGSRCVQRNVVRYPMPAMVHAHSEPSVCTSKICKISHVMLVLPSNAHATHRKSSSLSSFSTGSSRCTSSFVSLATSNASGGSFLVKSFHVVASRIPSPSTLASNSLARHPASLRTMGSARSRSEWLSVSLVVCCVFATTWPTIEAMSLR